MENVLEVAEQMQQEAWRVVEETGVIRLWSSIGATVNLVGSLKTGLLVHHRDVDFHIYTNPFSLADSFSAMARLAENSRIRTISYTNLLAAEDGCLEWHATYEAPSGHSWQLDMIHILQESPYAGYFEKVAERIAGALTEETREAILRIKLAIPESAQVMSIQVYRAVIEGGVRDVESFWRWREQHPSDGIVTWVP